MRVAALTYHADHLGSVRTLSTADGQAAGSYDYDSYGRLLSEAEPPALAPFGQPFGYTGRERDRAAGLTHYRARAYDPETGTFLQEDPIGFAAGDLNTSRYVWNSPRSGGTWRTLEDSNLWPLPSEGSALSS